MDDVGAYLIVVAVIVGVVVLLIMAANSAAKRREEEARQYSIWEASGTEVSSISCPR
jgi:hypothetical protein